MNTVSPTSSTGTVVSPASTDTTIFDDFDLVEAEDVPEVVLSRSPTSVPYPGAFSDFHGFPSNPVCVYRTGDEWLAPRGPEAQCILREARPICNHPIQDVWPTLGKRIYEFLDSLGVEWSTIDPVRFAEEGGEADPLHLWIGIVPQSLSLEDAKAAAVGCKEILADAQFPDVEIAFGESMAT